MVLFGKKIGLAIKPVSHGLQCLLLMVLSLLAWVIARKAFIVEDAFINFINFRNFHDGFYYSVLPDVRTESSTSSLWTLLLLFGSFFTSNLNEMTIYLSFFMSGAAVIAFIYPFLRHQRIGLAIGAVSVLVASTSFTDYSTSGLENPLAHCLVIVFFVYLFENRRTMLDFVWLSFIASLVVINRYDHLLLVVPSLLGIFLQRKHYRADIKAGLLGFLPLFVWFLFSWFYYGSIFPDTYYAKVATGVPFFDHIHLSILYVLRMLDFDPVGSYMMVASLFITMAMTGSLFKHLKNSTVVFSEKRMKLWLLGLGIALYNLYFMYVGGDYMVGRLTSITVLLSVFFVFSWWEEPLLNNTKKAALISIIMLGFAIKWFHIEVFVPRSDDPTNDMMRASTMNMKKFYVNWYFNNRQHGDDGWHFLGLSHAIDAENKNYPVVMVGGSAGIIPYYAGPKVRLIDVYAITDPLLARLPCRMETNAGHAMRDEPSGYRYFIKTGDSKQMDPDLAAYAVPLFLIKSLPLFDKERIRLLVRFTMGQYNAPLKRYIAKHKNDYYQPGLKKKYVQSVARNSIVRDFPSWLNLSFFRQG